MLRGMFGKPQISADNYLSDGKQGVYGWRDAGCVIQYIEDDNHTTIIVLRKPKKAEQAEPTVPVKAAPGASSTVR